MAHKIREVYIVHHSHTDVGYTDLQEQVIYNQTNNIRRAVELIEEGLGTIYAPRFLYLHTADALDKHNM